MSVEPVYARQLPAPQIPRLVTRRISPTDSFKLQLHFQVAGKRPKCAYLRLLLHRHHRLLRQQIIDAAAKSSDV